MIHHVKGRVHSRGADYVILESGQLGYHIQTPVDVAQRLTEGQEAFLYVHHQLNIDQTKANEQLFGFIDLEVRDFFRLLLTVKGIGPRQALTIISGCGTSQAIEAITLGDDGFLKKIKGIGPKTAQRLVLELKDKVGTLSKSSKSPTTKAPDALEDTLAALIALGYKDTQSEKLAKTVHSQNPDADVATLVRLTLQKI